MADVQEAVETNIVLASSKSPPTDDAVEKAPAGLLVIIGEVHSVEQRDLALQRLVEGLASFDSEASGVNLDNELSTLVKQPLKGVTDQSGETVYEHRSSSLHLDVLINPRFQVVEKHLHSFLLNNHGYRYLLFSGLTIHSSGGWLLQDGHFGFSSVSEIFHRPDILQALSKQQQQQHTNKLDISVVAEVGDWIRDGVIKLTSQLAIRLNPPNIATKSDGISSLSAFLSSSVFAPSVSDLLVSTKTLGNFSRATPTLHIFPGGNGDSSLFMVNGLSILFDGGFCRRSCFWEMVRHLSTLDAVVISHFGPDNLFGFGSFLEKKVLEKGFPELGAVLLNAPEHKMTAVGEKNLGLLVNIAEKGAEILENLRNIGTSVVPCLGSIRNSVLQPIQLYHKVGHGSADLYVINPLPDNKESKDLLTNWAKNLGVHRGRIPILDNISLCSILVWKSASTNEDPVRVLFSGNAPQTKIFEGLDRLKMIGIFQTATGKEKPAVGGVGKIAKGKEKNPQSKDINRPATATETKSVEQTKKVDHIKETKKMAAETKENKKQTSVENKNGKTVATATKREMQVKTTGQLKSGKMTGDGDAVKKKVSGKESAGTDADKSSPVSEGEKKVDVEEASSFPLQSDTAEPVDSNLVDVGNVTKVQALPEPEEVRAEAQLARDGTNVGSLEENKMKPGFDPTKDWGIPEGLPAPVNGKEQGTTKKPVGLNVSLAGAAAHNPKKTGDVPKVTEMVKRPTTAPERLNNTVVKEEAEKEKTATNQSVAKGRHSVTGIISAKSDPKRQAPRPVVPFYVDAAYVPAHGNLDHFDVDFFRRVRARNYILSSVVPNPKVFRLLIEGKQMWEDASAETTIVPTYDSEALIAWLGENADQLQKLNIKVAPSASKCTMQFQEINTICSSYRLDF